jgi:O-antigen/teichoic acid export membrane protein
MRREGLLSRGFWLCPAISLVLAAAVLIGLGVNWWAALVAAGLLGCFVAAVWTVVADRFSHRAIERAAVSHRQIREDGDRYDG